MALSTPLRNLLPLPPIIGLPEVELGASVCYFYFPLVMLVILLLTLLNFKEKIQGECGLLCNIYFRGNNSPIFRKSQIFAP